MSEEFLKRILSFYEKLKCPFCSEYFIVDWCGTSFGAQKVDINVKMHCPRCFLKGTHELTLDEAMLLVLGEKEKVVKEIIKSAEVGSE